MSTSKAIPPEEPGRRLEQMFKPGDKVRVLKGKYEGKIMTVRACTTDEVFLAECHTNESMSKGNITRIEAPGQPNIFSNKPDKEVS